MWNMNRKQKQFPFLVHNPVSTYTEVGSYMYSILVSNCYLSNKYSNNFIANLQLPHLKMWIRTLEEHPGPHRLESITFSIAAQCSHPMSYAADSFSHGSSGFDPTDF